MPVYSSEYLAVIVMVLAKVLPLVGIEVGSEALTTTATTLIAVVSGLYLLFKRWKRGGVSALGVRTQ